MPYLTAVVPINADIALDKEHIGVIMSRVTEWLRLTRTMEEKHMPIKIYIAMVYEDKIEYYDTKVEDRKHKKECFFEQKTRCENSGDLYLS
eukprot:CAMPEP_0171474340 /NCGR_PEP_ID=MMETSP0946-20130122/2369_1 /TAXON_ID=109269 /ORGANISM="Vaucheria litorea, Strain CCMP2940" /LENGTH=90 /DNA_ID=CAMNT_0012004257 /DNA_START=307 /DNA_END=579 /DNA_ORIENTATION=+